MTIVLICIQAVSIMMISYHLELKRIEILFLPRTTLKKFKTDF